MGAAEHMRAGAQRQRWSRPPARRSAQLEQGHGSDSYMRQASWRAAAVWWPMAGNIAGGQAGVDLGGAPICSMAACPAAAGRVVRLAAAVKRTAAAGWQWLEWASVAPFGWLAGCARAATQPQCSSSLAGWRAALGRQRSHRAAQAGVRAAPCHPLCLGSPALLAACDGRCGQQPAAVQQQLAQPAPPASVSQRGFRTSSTWGYTASWHTAAAAAAAAAPLCPCRRHPERGRGPHSCCLFRQHRIALSDRRTPHVCPTPAGATVNVGVDPSKVVVTKLKLDKDRRQLLERKRAVSCCAALCMLWLCRRPVCQAPAGAHAAASVASGGFGLRALLLAGWAVRLAVCASCLCTRLLAPPFNPCRTSAGQCSAVRLLAVSAAHRAVRAAHPSAGQGPGRQGQVHGGGGGGHGERGVSVVALPFVTPLFPLCYSLLVCAFR